MRLDTSERKGYMVWTMTDEQFVPSPPKRKKLSHATIWWIERNKKHSGNTHTFRGQADDFVHAFVRSFLLSDKS